MNKGDQNKIDVEMKEMREDLILEQIVEFYKRSDLSLDEKYLLRSLVGELIERHYDWISKMCLMNISNYENSLDCTQEVLIQITKSLPRFEKKSKFKTWAFTITKRCIADYRKRDYKRKSYVIESENENEFEDLESKDSFSLVSGTEKSKKLLELVNSLPEKQRYAIMLHYFEDCSIEKAAEIMGTKVGTLKAHLFRARKKLEKLIDKKEFKELFID